MGILEKKSDDCFLLRIHVKPNSKAQNIITNGDFLRINLRSKAIKNKANKELLNLLKKKMKIHSNQIIIKSGLKSTNKIIELKFKGQINEHDLIKRLLA
ncbi:MAG: DUF167 domain-containing protein [Promethearchaeota archaeon]